MSHLRSVLSPCPDFNVSPKMASKLRLFRAKCVKMATFSVQMCRIHTFPTFFKGGRGSGQSLWYTLGSLWDTLGSLWRLLADFFVKEASSGRPFRPKGVEFTFFWVWYSPGKIFNIFRKPVNQKNSNQKYFRSWLCQAIWQIIVCFAIKVPLVCASIVTGGKITDIFAEG